MSPAPARASASSRDFALRSPVDHAETLRRIGDDDVVGDAEFGDERQFLEDAGDAGLVGGCWPDQAKPEDDARMVDAAHASQYHWREAGDQPETRGEWLVSHVYAVLGRPEPALHHARRCLELADGEPAWPTSTTPTPPRRWPGRWPAPTTSTSPPPGTRGPPPPARPRRRRRGPPDLHRRPRHRPLVRPEPALSRCRTDARCCGDGPGRER